MKRIGGKKSVSRVTDGEDKKRWDVMGEKEANHL